MKKYKKIIIIALCFALLLSMFTFSTFAADEPSDSEFPVMPIDDDELYVYYLPPDSVTGDFSISGISCVVITFEQYFTSISITFSGSSVLFNSDLGEISISRNSDFMVFVTTPISEFSEFVVDISAFISDFSVTVPSGWTVSPGFSTESFSVVGSVNGFPFSRIAFGYDLSEVPTSDSFIAFDFVSGSTQFTTLDSLQFDVVSYDDLSFLYFLFHNGAVIESPPTILDSIFDVFLSIGQWISGAVSSLVPMFWTGTELTFVGMLSVSSLALSVVFLVLYFIERFLRFGG